MKGNILEKVFWEPSTMTIRKLPENYCLAYFENGEWKTFKMEAATKYLHNNLDSLLFMVGKHNPNVIVEEIEKLLDEFKKKDKNMKEYKHRSDCAVYNMPAYPNGKCDCMVHLCETCIYDFADCMGKELIFSSEIDSTLTGAMADIVVKCDTYKKMIYEKNQKGEIAFGEFTISIIVWFWVIVLLLKVMKYLL